MCFKYLMVLGSLIFFFGCSSTSYYKNSEKYPNRMPANYKVNGTEFTISSVNLIKGSLVGKCDLATSSFVKESSILSATKIISLLNMPEKNCALKLDSKVIGVNSNLVSAIVYFNFKTSQLVELEFTIGDMEYANDEEIDTQLEAKGYTDVHLTGKGVYKLKAVAKVKLSASCEDTERVGVYGFRKESITCKVGNNFGTVSFIEK